MGNIANLITYVGAATGDFHKGMAGVISKGGEVAAGFAKIGAVAVTALAGAAVAAGKMAADFQDQMADVATLIDGDATAAMERFGADVKRISVMTGKDLANVNAGLYEVISAFGDSADAAKQLEIATKAAVGGKAETLDAVKMLSVVTKGYGDTSAAAVQKVADLAFQTANLGQTTFPELANEMGNVVPLAATLTVKQEQLFGAMATLTGVTGSTAEVATQLRATMQALINPSSQMAAKLSKLGFANGKAAIESLGLQGTLDLLSKSTGGNTAELAKMFGSVEALNAVLALTGNQSADFTAKTQAMTTAAGAADAAFEKKRNTVNGMLASLKQMGTVAMVELGEKFLPILMKGGQWVMANMPTIQAAFDVAFKAIGAVVNWLGGVFTWFKDNVLTQFLRGWNGDIVGMVTPLKTLGFEARMVWESIAGFFRDFRQNVWEPFVEGWRNGAGDMSNVWQTIGARIGSIVQSIWSIIKGVWELLVMYWKTWGDDVMKIARIVWETVLGVIDGALKVVDGIIKFFIALFKGDWQGMWEAIKQIWEGLWQIIVSVATGAWELIKALWNVMVEATVAVFNWIVKAVTDLWAWMWDGITDMVSGAWEWLKGSFGTLWENIKGWFTDLAKAAINWGSDLMSGFWDGITGWFGRIWDGLKDFAGQVTNTVKDALGINSPSRVFMDIGHNLGAGLALGIEGTESMVNRALADITPGGVNMAVRSVGAGGSVTGGQAAGAPARAITIPVYLDGQKIAEYTVDLLTGIVRQPARAAGAGGTL